ncbi:MAG: hypothetical protein H6622_01040 [Halobacteriovoraceae bacterium]|nr:hypothetical protein [Halobacteriovoraceae bacterium]
MKYLISLLTIIIATSCGEIISESNFKTIDFKTFLNQNLSGTYYKLEYTLIIRSDKSYTFTQKDPENYKNSFTQKGGVVEVEGNRKLINESDGVFGEIKISSKDENCIRLSYELEEDQRVHSVTVCK